MMWMAFLACAVDDVRPAATGSPSAAEVAAIAHLDELAATIESESIELQKQSEALRDLPPEQRDAAVAGLQPRLKAIEAADAELQTKLAELETRVAGGIDPHKRPPPPP